MCLFSFRRLLVKRRAIGKSRSGSEGGILVEVRRRTGKQDSVCALGNRVETVNGSGPLRLRRSNKEPVVVPFDTARGGSTADGFEVIERRTPTVLPSRNGGLGRANEVCELSLIEPKDVLPNVPERIHAAQ